MKCADTIDEFTILARAKARENFSYMLLNLFTQMDQSGDGMISKGEVYKYTYRNINAITECLYMYMYAYMYIYSFI